MPEESERWAACQQSTLRICGWMRGLGMNVAQIVRERILGPRARGRGRHVARPRSPIRWRSTSASGPARAPPREAAAASRKRESSHGSKRGRTSEAPLSGRRRPREAATRWRGLAVLESRCWARSCAGRPGHLGAGFQAPRGPPAGARAGQDLRSVNVDGMRVHRGKLILLDEQAHRGRNQREVLTTIIHEFAPRHAPGRAPWAGPCRDLNGDARRLVLGDGRAARLGRRVVAACRAPHPVTPGKGVRGEWPRRVCWRAAATGISR